MPKFTVTSPIKHDGERHEIGETVELSAKVAKPLLELGAITPTAKTAAGTQTQTDSTTELLSLLDQPIPKIVAAITARDGDANCVIPTDHLEMLREAEQNGKTRKGLMDAIDAELASRAE